MTDKTSSRPLRILCISPAFVPQPNSEAFCGAKMVLALMAEGAEVRVLKDPRIHELPDVGCDTSGMWNALGEVVATTPPADRDMLRAVCHSVRYLAYSRWADVALLRARQLHRDKPFDVVYSRSLPPQAHVVGFWCARGLDIPWVANINDPWDVHLFPGGGKEKVSWARALLSRYWLRKTIREAEVVTYPCRRLADFTCRLAGVQRRSEVIPHVGFSLPAEDRQEGFHLVHAGKLGAHELTGGRSARGLLVGLKTFLESHTQARALTTLTLVGPRDPETVSLITGLGLERTVTCTGTVSYEDSLKQIASASVCVLVEAEMSEGIYLPSKFADYVVARKPILALGPRVGTIADMLPDPGLMRVDVDDAAAAADAIRGFYEDFRRGGLDARRPSEKLFQEFSSSSVAGKFLSVLDRAGIRPRKGAKTSRSFQG